MVPSQLISTLREFSRSDKLYIMQILVSELAQQETDLIKSDLSYPVCSPYDAVEAADTMLKVMSLKQGVEKAMSLYDSRSRSVGSAESIAIPEAEG
nr:hypothetical protein [Chamaesiphon polymorphus]